MSEPELPKPIYPPNPSGPGGAGGGAWGAPAGPPAAPSGPPPAGPPAGGSGFGGYGAGPGGPGGPGTGGSGDKNRTIAIVAVIAVVIAAVVGVVIATSGDDGKSTSASDSTTTTAQGGATGSSTPDGTTETSDPGGDDPDVQAIAEQQVISAGPSTVSCIASELEAAPDLVAQLDGVDYASFDDPTQADEYANILVDCASSDELTTEFQNALSQNGVDQASIDCIVFNMGSFGTTQWVELISTSVQPSQSSYLTQLIQQLAVC